MNFTYLLVNKAFLFTYIKSFIKFLHLLASLFSRLAKTASQP